MTQAIRPQTVGALLRRNGVRLSVRGRCAVDGRGNRWVECHSMIVAGGDVEGRVAAQLSEARRVLAAHGYLVRAAGAYGLIVHGRSAPA